MYKISTATLVDDRLKEVSGEPACCDALVSHVAPLQLAGAQVFAHASITERGAPRRARGPAHAPP